MQDYFHSLPLPVAISRDKYSFIVFYSLRNLMKVVYPKNIQKGLFAGMTFTIGPLTISIIQLFILAIGIAIALAAFNTLAKAGSKILGIFVALIILIIFIIVVFFKVSELSLIPFLAKMARNNFFDTKKKYQVNYNKENPLDILLQETRAKEEKQVIEYKSGKMNKQKIADIEKSGLI